MTSETKAVLQNQAAIKEAEQTIAQLEAALQEQERIIAAGVVPGREELDRGREDVLAALAVGKATTADLAEADSRITAHGEAVKAAEKVIAPAQATFAGLRRKLEQAGELQARLTKTRAIVREALYRAEAEKVGAEYIRTAHELHTHIKLLVGLNELLGENSLGVSTMSYSVPALNLEAFKYEPKCGPYREFLHHTSELSGGGDWERRLATHRARGRDHLRTLGVDPE